MTKNIRLKREEVEEKKTWDLTDLYTDHDQWEDEVTSIQNDVKTITKYRGKLQSDAKTLYKCLSELEVFQERLIRMSTYASLKANADGTNPTNQRDAAKASATLAHIQAQLSFVESEILAIPEEKINRFFNEYKGLTNYTKFLHDLLERKSYTLLPELEEALAALSEVHNSPYMIYQRSKSSDMEFASITDEKGHELPMSFALYEDRYEISPHTYIRRKAYESFTNTLNQYKHTFAATYATEVTKQVTMARLRNYDSVTDMLLHPQQVTKDMYNRQLDLIQKELAPHMRRYIRLKQQQLGLEEMRFCDLQVSIDPDFNPKTTYEEATEIIIEALKIMGPEYTSIMQQGIHNRWIDYADNIGKSTGAFCASPYGVHPYILITWTDTMRGAFVLAHELGHAGHFYLAGQNQSLLNTRPSTYFIEAPSTLNELLLADYLLENTKDKRMRRWILDQLLGTYYHNFITHLLEGEFQRRVYSLAEEGLPLTEQILTGQKRETLENFWGDAVRIDAGASLTWMRQPHYYMGLYPYTYSAGLTVSTAVSQQIKAEGKPAVDRWLEVLKLGGTMKPLELIRRAGIDMTKPDAIVNAVAFVGSLIDELVESYR